MIDLKKFESWVKSVEPDVPAPVPGSMDKWLRTSGNTPQNFINKITSADGIHPIHATINGSNAEIPSAFNLDFPKSNSGIIPGTDRISDISRLTISDNARVNSVFVSNCSVKNLRVQGKIELILHNCMIGHLDIQKPSGSTQHHNIKIFNSWIGHITLKSDSVDDFYLKGGGVLDLICPPPEQTGPFVGSVEFAENVFFPTRKSHSSLYRGPQCYRNLRAHLEGLQNIPLTNYLRAKELEAEADPEAGNDTFLNRCLNRTYGVLSGYGEKAGRPILWMILIWALTASALWQFDDGGQPGLTETKRYIGARSALTSEEYGKVARSVFLPVEATFNPLGAYSAQPLVVTNHWLAAVIVRAAGLLSDVMIFLSIMAIRRRFKLP